MRKVHELKGLQEELASWPGAIYSVESGSKHPRLRLRANGQEDVVTVSGTTRCPRAHLNNVSLIRRKLRSMSLKRLGNG